jgi:hypothetical protein
VAEILGNLDAEFLSRANCYFGGGTQIALANGEYRESRDVDFICSSRDGFRLLRESVHEASLGRILRREMVLARGVRADRDGIRTFIAGNPPDPPVKFEILYEARIDATGAIDGDLGVPVLDPETLRAGLAKAQAAYGAAVLEYLEKSARRLHDDRAWLRKCINDLMVDDEKGLRRGLRALLAFLPAGRKKSPPARPRSGKPG